MRKVRTQSKFLESNALIRTKQRSFENIASKFSQCDIVGCQPIPLRFITKVGEGKAPTLIHPDDRLWRGIAAEELRPQEVLDSTPLNDPWIQFFVSKPADMSARQQRAFDRWHPTAEAAGMEIAGWIQSSVEPRDFPRNPLTAWVYYLREGFEAGFSMSVDRDGEGGFVFQDVLFASCYFSGWLASNDWPLVQPDSDSVANGGKANRKRKKNSTEDHADWEEVYREYEKSNLKGDRKAAKKGDCTRKFQAFYESRKDLQNWTMKVAWKKTEAARKRIARRA